MRTNCKFREHFFKFRMDAERYRMPLGYRIERRYDGAEHFFIAHVFAPVEGDEHFFAFGWSLIARVFGNDFGNGISGDDDFGRMASLAKEVFATSLGVGKEPVGEGVHDSPVGFFGNPLVVTAVSGFHVKHWNAPAFARVGREGRISVSENEGGRRLFFFEDLVNIDEELADVGESDEPFLGIELVVGLSKVQVFEKLVVELGGEVLSGVDENVVGEAVELFNDFGKPDEFGPRSRNGDDFSHGLP